MINSRDINKYLDVIIVYYNYCQYQSRYNVSKDFIERYSSHPKINLYVVELVYGNANFFLTEEDNKNHLQLRTEHPLWHKENLINIGIEKLLPKNWQNVAWIDCNLEFENKDFVEKTLKQLERYDFAQMFSLIKYQSSNKNDDKTESFKSLIYSISGTNYDISSKPGGAWACTKEGYNKIGKLFDKSLCESDCVLAQALGLKKNYYFNNKKNVKYLEYVDQYVKKIINQNITVSYANNIVIYYWHGNQENRSYHLFRKQMLMKYDYNPDFFSYDKNGILVPNNNCAFEILDYIRKYFERRMEDKN